MAGNHDFKAGDVVVLKSGSPDMTVHERRNDGMITCVWFDKDGAKQTNVFVAATLEPSES